MYQNNRLLLFGLIHTSVCPIISFICAVISKHGSEVSILFCHFPCLLLNQNQLQSIENPIGVCSDSAVNHGFAWGKWWDKRKASRTHV